jgi:hypothetical protein
MNVRVHDLVVILRGILGMFPGATAISFHGVTASWTYILITASTDATVRALGRDLGLGAPEIRTDDKTWWLRAMSESARGDLRVEVYGPHHPGPPPAHGDTEESPL